MNIILQKLSDANKVFTNVNGLKKVPTWLGNILGAISMVFGVLFGCGVCVKSGKNRKENRQKNDWK